MYTFKLHSDNGDILATFHTRNQFAPVPGWFYRMAMDHGIDTYCIVGPRRVRWMSF